MFARWSLLPQQQFPAKGSKPYPIHAHHEKTVSQNALAVMISRIYYQREIIPSY